MKQKKKKSGICYSRFTYMKDHKVLLWNLSMRNPVRIQNLLKRELREINH